MVRVTGAAALSTSVKVSLVVLLVVVAGATDGFGDDDDSSGGVAVPRGWWRACGPLNAKAVCSRTSWRVWAQVWRRFRGGRIGRKISSSM
jgi:hypothetical protein